MASFYATVLNATNKQVGNSTALTVCTSTMDQPARRYLWLPWKSPFYSRPPPLILHSEETQHVEWRKPQQPTLNPEEFATQNTMADHVRRAWQHGNHENDSEIANQTKPGRRVSLKLKTTTVLIMRLQQTQPFQFLIVLYTKGETNLKVKFCKFPLPPNFHFCWRGDIGGGEGNIRRCCYRLELLPD